MKVLHTIFTAGMTENGPEELETACQSLKNAGFRSKDIVVYIMAGLPGHAEEVEATVQSVARFGVRVSVSEFSPVPGSLLWEDCVKKSSYPLDKEPLFQNNTIFPMSWEGFTHKDLWRIKMNVRSLNSRLR